MRIYFHNIWIIRWCWYGLFFCQKKTVRVCEWASASPALVFIFVIFTHSFSFCLSWMVFVECAVLQQEQEQNKRAKARAKLQHCSGLIMLIERIDDGDMRTVFMCAFVCSIYMCCVCACRICGGDGDQQQMYRYDTVLALIVSPAIVRVSRMVHMNIEGD